MIEATQEISQPQSKPKEDPNSYFALKTLNYLTVKDTNFYFIEMIKEQSIEWLKMVIFLQLIYLSERFVYY